jgi:hypothetical protein
MEVYTMALTLKEQVERVEAVILNKVEGLTWYYFEIDLNKLPLDSDADNEAAILDSIVPTSLPNRYRWTGAPEEQERLMLAIMRTLRHQQGAAKHLFRRIFDGNVIRNDSGSHSGLLGKFNRGDERQRRRRYERDVRRGSNAHTIVAEGDSWFQFPSIGWWRLRWYPVRDIIDHLSAMPHYRIHSLAAGGDWLSNMLRTNDYIPVLSRIEPDVFLFSAGGNDLVGSRRIGNMVRRDRRRRDLKNDKLLLRLNQRRHQMTARGFDRKRYENGLTLLDDEFFEFMNLIFVQYFLFFLNLRSSGQLSDMIIITQGYDYAMPRRTSTARLYHPRRWLSSFSGSGKWLWLPLEEKQIPDDDKRDVVHAMITEFNELMGKLAECDEFGHLYHFDFRGLAGEDDWYDEIHLNSRAFSRAAAALDRGIKDALAYRLGNGAEPPHVYPWYHGEGLEVPVVSPVFAGSP